MARKAKAVTLSDADYLALTLKRDALTVAELHGQAEVRAAIEAVNAKVETAKQAFIQTFEKVGQKYGIDTRVSHRFDDAAHTLTPDTGKR